MIACLRFLPALQRLRFGLDQLAQRRGEIRLPENLAGLRRGALACCLTSAS